MQHQPTRYGFALRLDAGEEIVTALAAFAADRGVRAGMISGLGAVGETELGFFVRATRSYVRRRFTGEYEIGSLVGNLSELEGRPFPHCHLMIAGQDFAAHAGHLFSAIVTVTAEIQIVSDPGVLRRVLQSERGFHSLELGG